MVPSGRVDPRYAVDKRWRTNGPMTSKSLLAATLLGGCGGGTGGGSAGPAAGLPAAYVPPSSTYVPPVAPDPNAFVLQTALVAPFWVQALANDDFENLPAFYQSFENEVQFAFPTEQPAYYSGDDAVGWAPASAQVQAAFRAVFTELSQIVNVRFVETDDVEAYNVIAISQNDQQEQGLAGYAYFPNASFFIGSDILLSNVSDAPALQAGRSNEDYELVLHELGHALGLKHPFAADGDATTLLSASEDNSVWTVMTYTLQPSAYDGAFRAFDLMAFAEIFGVNSGYRAGDDSYGFSAASGQFVIDGGGIDTISADGAANGAYIDLRPGMQSYVGSKSSLISAPFQLTISAGSAIENATGGAGADYLYGNALANTLRGGTGQDRIFGGEGRDTIIAGAGDDIIDLSEVTTTSDTVVFESEGSANGRDTVYGFAQGAAGDVIDFAPMLGATLLSVVADSLVPIANISGMIARLVGSGLDDADAIDRALSEGGAFDNLVISAGRTSLVLAAASQATGQDQHLFQVGNVGGGIVAHELAVFRGVHLDIDSWHAHNFA